MKGIGEDPKGGFFGEVDVVACCKSGAGHPFEATEKALDIPAFAITRFLESLFGHFRSIDPAQTAICTGSCGFDNALHPPNLTTDSVNPIRIVTRVRIHPLWQVWISRIKTLLQQLKGLALVVTRSPVKNQSQGEKTAADHCQGKLDPFASLATGTSW